MKTRTIVGIIMMGIGLLLILLPIVYKENIAVTFVSGVLIYIVGAFIISNINEDYIEGIKQDGGKDKMTKTKEHRHCIKCGKVIEDMSRTVCEECIDEIISEVGAVELNESIAKEELDNMAVPGIEKIEDNEVEEEGDLEVPADSNGILEVDDDVDEEEKKED